ncbi:hypothetical protein BACOVA_01300 [Bacteroides ovatus ATCC 8483]|uniref:Uncharacterized protein n=1 Tax=Bacteroides ovatus (strain ATCC 8483 / DSM 1896 / JCM 5824 / BCRC 10623 / CCUG 4943 / NCTC 11153) TaxID=411476 RepID=A0AAN3AB75_BACO1|nr:hypothetical protein BACOVA_01300 [Bacteroides ovatus ATCC 8483]
MVKKGSKEVKGVKANGYKESENTLFFSK